MNSNLDDKDLKELNVNILRLAERKLPINTTDLGPFVEQLEKDGYLLRNNGSDTYEVTESGMYYVQTFQTNRGPPSIVPRFVLIQYDGKGLKRGQIYAALKERNYKVGESAVSAAIERHGIGIKRLRKMERRPISVSQTEVVLKEPKYSEEEYEGLCLVEQPRIKRFRRPRSENLNPINMDDLKLPAITEDELTNAIMRKYDRIKLEEARGLAQHVLGFFGYSAIVIDNVLEPEDRDAFYMLEDAGFLRTWREETTLYDGREWRIHYWMFNKSIIRGEENKECKKELSKEEQLYFNEVPQETWQRPNEEKVEVLANGSN